MNTTQPTPQPEQPKKPEVVTPEFLHWHLLEVLKKESKAKGVSVDKLCILIATNLVPIFMRMSDAFGVTVHTHPLMPANKVMVKTGRVDLGEKRLNDMWRFVRVL